jgi:hypothetical protein
LVHLFGSVDGKPVNGSLFLCFFWDHEFDNCLIHLLVVCVYESDLNLVRTCWKTGDIIGLAAGVDPMPWRIMAVTIARKPPKTSR